MIKYNKNEQAVRKVPRWVPPSTSRRDEPGSRDQQDLVFRRVRGILNKLTPEKFDKLCLELLNVGIHSKVILKGIILLVFEKALEEPKYSSMYSQLCKRLDEDAPDFEPAGSNVKTFRRLLISKCQDEFENRSRAFAAYDKQNGPLTPEEQDQRGQAKAKMLGNIQFIGELGKLGMLHESILHRCIKQLLEKKSRESLGEKAEDLECLCKIISTVGGRLDHDKARTWMDQYFDRMTRFSENMELPSRIRFMLQDSLELRDNEWKPRRRQTDHGPRTIRQIHQEELKREQQSNQAMGRFTPDFFNINGGGSGAWPARGGLGDLFLQDTMSGRVGAGPGVISDELSPNPGFGSYSPRTQHRQMGQQQQQQQQGQQGQQRGSNNRSDSGDRQRDQGNQQGGYQNQAPRFQQRGGNQQRGNRNDDNQQQQRYQQRGGHDQQRSGYDHQRGSGNQQHHQGRNMNQQGQQQQHYQQYPPPQQQQRDYNQGGYNNKQQNKQYYNNENQDYGGRGGSGERDRDRDWDGDRGGRMGNRGGGMDQGRYGQQRQDRGQQDKPYGGGQQRDGGGGGGGRQRDDVRESRPPRINKLDTGEINLRPSGNMVLKPQVPRFLPPSATSNSPNSSPPRGIAPIHGLLPTNPPPNNVQQPPPLQTGYPGLPVKHSAAGSLGGGTGGAPAGERRIERKKQPTKEELLKSMEELLTTYLESKDDEAVIKSFKGLQAPKRHVPALLTYVMTHCIQQSDTERESAANLLSVLKKEGCITGNNFMDAFTSFLESSKELESEVPLIKSHTAGLAARAVTDEVVSLADIADPLENGAFYPLFLLILQRIAKAKSKDGLVALFNESKVAMLKMLPESDRNKERMMEILEGKSLSFLFPLLRMQADVTKQLQSDSNPSALYKWIKENVSVTIHKDKGFINALTASVIKFIVAETSLPEGADPAVLPDKSLQEKETALLERFAPVLQKFVHVSIDLQLGALYALQTQCYNLSFPKGMLLRFFVNLYNLEAIEEEAFIKWKEDITDEFPGKGQALFQVNQWLTWLATAEEDSDSDEEVDD
ncbi:eukaryotic translation initiation factor 4 gamma 2-like isoform X1 [Strongylocentrotus purpuratus]|uniref:Eukaryotic translation initiation factor 4 gamma 2 n=2 Tax=Strongylocentrotus purpuratus TaxID=7668 RepID=A0A7M7P4E8_STRPU|nr:eukaryotic translation initiation factor 4 gamma 2-like isoform X1 [Strongylocentrotus purpuratus]